MSPGPQALAEPGYDEELVRSSPVEAGGPGSTGLGHLPRLYPMLLYQVVRLLLFGLGFRARVGSTTAALVPNSDDKTQYQTSGAWWRHYSQRRRCGQCHRNRRAHGCMRASHTRHGALLQGIVDHVGRLQLVVVSPRQCRKNGRDHRKLRSSTRLKLARHMGQLSSTQGRKHESGGCGPQGGGRRLCRLWMLAVMDSQHVLKRRRR